MDRDRKNSTFGSGNSRKRDSGISGRNKDHKSAGEIRTLKRETMKKNRVPSGRELTEEELSGRIEGRNSVIEAFRSGRQIDKLFIQEELHDGPVNTILREAKKHDTIVSFVTKERLDEMSVTEHHQGVIAQAAAFAYAEVDDILKAAEERGEAPFVILLDGIEDPFVYDTVIVIKLLGQGSQCQFVGIMGLVYRKVKVIQQQEQ